MPPTRMLDTVWAPRLLSVIRIIAGLMFLEHGLQKLIGFPVPPGAGLPGAFSLPWFAALIETFGGALVALGFLTRPVAFLLSGEMAVAYFMVHAPKSFFPIVNGGDAAILYCFVFLYLCVAGGGVWSVDSARAGHPAGLAA